MFLNHVWLGLGWAAYGVVHSVLASMAVKDFFRQRLPKAFRYYRLSYNLIAFAGLGLLVCFQLQLHSVDLFNSTAFSNVSGAVIGLAGLALMGVCVKKYFLNLSGLRSLVQEENFSHLEVTGVHRHLRHPLYLGTFLFLWGLFIFFPTASLFVSNAVITVYTLVAIRFEEAKLVAQFGQAYVRYQKTVPMLVPRWSATERQGNGQRQKQSVRR